MKAGETSLIKLLNGSLQFIVPIYQRTYSWTAKQCSQLWKDIIQITRNKDGMVHFIGSVVYIDLGTPLGRPQQLLLIDGQQRLTTLSLLLCALSRYMEENGITSSLITSNKIKNQFLFNIDENGTDRYKIILTEQDKETFIRILDGTEKTMLNPSEQMLKNFYFFADVIQKSGEAVETIYEGINRLMLVAVALDKTQDNPQLIFESMNSTGKDLTQADLIRNYILMDLAPDVQERLYNTYWRPMEQGFGQQGYNDYFDWFMRDFLTSQSSSGRICKINEVYETFKQYHYERRISKEELLAEVFTYAQYYIRIHLGQEKDPDLKRLWSQIKALDVSVSYPFLMRVYNDYEKGIIDKNGFMAIIKATISYVVRRAICDIPTNSLNKTFATFYGRIQKERYVSSVLAEYVTKDSYRVFPTDEEFKAKFKTKEIYKLRIRNYILESLENQFHKKEPISITGDGYTIEHIMPQNPELRQEWRNMLGENWQEIQKKYLHTIGNLTLTGYNKEMGDRPFEEKQSMDGGFKKSPLWLNEGLGDLPKWDEEEICRRAEKLADQAVAIWPYPVVSQADIEAHMKQDKAEPVYTSMKHYRAMLPEIAEVYERLDRKLLSLDADVRKEYKKDYIAYKVDTDFVDIEPYKEHLKMWLNMPFDDVKDSKGLCKDVTNIKHMGNGDAEVEITADTDIDDLVDLARQALEYQMD